MASFSPPRGIWFLVLCICLALLPSKVAAFGAGNIPSIAQVEGHNWRHGDIEDMLTSIAFLHGKKWTSMLVKRTYFGNWLRDYSQAVDVGSLKGVNAPTIRILVWILSFMSFGYATEEFEVTEERLGCYRPEEHIDNPKGYADGIDARTLDPRLRGPVDPVEIDIDLNTGMKNYIANETGRWATSAGYLRYSFARSIHFGRLYTHGSQSGKEADLCEALRCLGQALHCMEDFSAHSNYCELALRELGHRQVFPHCGSQSEITVRGKRIFPLVTGTFGGVDFLHSVIGEANDHFTQSEVDEVDVALLNAGASNSGGGASRGLLDIAAPRDFISLIAKIPGDGAGFAAQARELQAISDAQERDNEVRSRAEGNANVVPGMSPNFDPVKTARQIYPILQFRDRIVKAISRGIEKIPGLEKLLEHISETLTAFILGLLAPFIRPIINQVSKVLKDGSSGVISASANSQFEPWENPRSSDPTHSMLSKDHFTNILNSCAGRIAATILQYTVPRVLYAWENPSVPVDEVINDVLRAFHHPALRHENIQIQRDMFRTVQAWADEHPRRHELDRLLSSESVKQGHNHILNQKKKGGAGGHAHDAWETVTQLGHGKVSGSLWDQVKTRDLNSIQGHDGNPALNYTSTSPAPPSRYSPPAQGGYGYGESASYLAQSRMEAPQGQPGHSSGYSQSHHNQPQHPQGYDSHPHQYQQQQYHHQQQQQQQYGGGEQWEQAQPPHGYGGPAQPQYAPYHGQGYQEPPPSWGSHHEHRPGY
ncbi:heterokaryon incompatibility het-c [Trichoderma cornu-damae]|uniref:Heterokaryon incompatibility het-c n=1 Tax=Trichoderma cornu-damae TaxID=654480 RepID=A0A9P8QRN4_9HYPO|nr:heterokaryon incompatibility het-c [Trichoderma cornu-damae]